MLHILPRFWTCQAPSDQARRIVLLHSLQQNTVHQRRTAHPMLLGDSIDALHNLRIDVVSSHHRLRELTRQRRPRRRLPLAVATARHRNLGELLLGAGGDGRSSGGQHLSFLGACIAPVWVCPIYYQPLDTFNIPRKITRLLHHTLDHLAIYLEVAWQPGNSTMARSLLPCHTPLKDTSLHPPILPHPSTQLPSRHHTQYDAE